MFRAVLSLQRKCRQWRVRIKEKMRQRVVEERQRQEAELQLRLHNLKEQRKHSQAIKRAASAAQPQSSHPPPAASPLPSPAPPPPPPTAASVWGVELPANADDRLRFTISMMKIQRLFRAKLVRARLRLVERLRSEKEEQEREMRARIEKRQQQRREQQLQQGRAQEQKQETEEKTQLSEEAQQQQPAAQQAPSSAQQSFSLPLHLLQEGKAEPLRGSLTSRLRHERQQQQQQQASAVKETRSIDIQVDAEELRETAALQSVPSAALRVELSSQSLPFIADSQLLDQHLQLMAALATLPVPAAASAFSVTMEAEGVGAEGGEFVLSSSPLLGLQFLSSALYSRVFDGCREDEGDDWESIIHLPLPAV